MFGKNVLHLDHISHASLRNRASSNDRMSSHRLPCGFTTAGPLTKCPYEWTVKSPPEAMPQIEQKKPAVVVGPAPFDHSADSASLSCFPEETDSDLEATLDGEVYTLHAVCLDGRDSHGMAQEDLKVPSRPTMG